MSVSYRRRSLNFLPQLSQGSTLWYNVDVVALSGVLVALTMLNGVLVFLVAVQAEQSTQSGSVS